MEANQQEGVTAAQLFAVIGEKEVTILTLRAALGRQQARIAQLETQMQTASPRRAEPVHAGNGTDD